MAIAVAAAVAGVSAEPEEFFEVYDEALNLIGIERRRIVHSIGLWHKAVYCFVFNPQGHLLIQRRSEQKKVGAGQWDLSVAEHLQPGETFKQGAERGLKEELGITASVSTQPLSSVHRRQLIIPDCIKDFEFVQSYQLQDWAGPIHFNTEEVSEVKYIDLHQLKQQLLAHPEQFTEWFIAELEQVGMVRPEKLLN